MNELEKFSDEEIKKEFWRRRTMKLKKYDIQYNYWEAVVIEEIVLKKKSTFDKYVYRLKPIYIKESLNGIENKKIPMHTKVGFKSSTRPRVGDIVKLQYIRHKVGIDYPDESKIIEIIKRKEDVD